MEPVEDALEAFGLLSPLISAALGHIGPISPIGPICATPLRGARPQTVNREP
jgi:hypothetical protein